MKHIKVNLPEFNEELRTRLAKEALSLNARARASFRGEVSPLFRVLTKAVIEVIDTCPDLADQPSKNLDNAGARRVWFHVVMAQINAMGTAAKQKRERNERAAAAARAEPLLQ